MSMVTRCPACGTVFRVGAQQLQARQGMVRCGRCQNVFDGFKTLASAPEAAAAPAEAAAAAQPAATPAPEPSGAAAAPLQDSVPSAPTPEPAPPAEPAEPAFSLEPVSATQLAAAAEPAPDSAARSAVADEAKDFGPAPEQLTIEDQLFLDQKRKAKARGAKLWAVGVVLLLFALTGQALYVYRGELAARSPGLRPYLVRACDALRCAIILPQQPRLIAIEASDLQAPDPARPGVIQLTATVRNHAGYDVGFPALDLVLTNSREHTLARRVFLPRDYLEPGRDPRAGIPDNAEVTIRLDLETGDLNPAGFRLDLLAAPAP